MIVPMQVSLLVNREHYKL